MFFEKIESEWLAHYSYIFGDGTQAAVVDPRRDVDAYLKIADREGVVITHIFETHRHEDFALGSTELAQRCGAQTWHAPEPGLDYRYGSAVSDGETFRIGRLKLEAHHIPGHTLGHMGYLLHDPGGAPWIFFSGDTLFAGEVGRIDFYGPERIKEMAALLFDSLQRRILPLGDEVLLCPAHGTGSVCGSAISERLWTSIGLERKQNPRLQSRDQADFTEEVGKVLDYPPYFAHIERLNTEGAPLLEPFPAPPPLSPQAFMKKTQTAQVIGLREVAAFGGMHVPGAYSMHERVMSHFTGWFLKPDQPILLVADHGAVEPAVRQLVRLGYDRVEGYLAGGMRSWQSAGLYGAGVALITPHELNRRVSAGEAAWALDVRGEAEKGTQGTPELPHVQAIPLPQIPERAGEVPSDRAVYVFCRTGPRAMLAASLLKPLGYDNLVVVMGGTTGWFASKG